MNPGIHSRTWAARPALETVVSSYYSVINASGQDSPVQNLSSNLQFILLFNFGPGWRYGMEGAEKLRTSIHPVQVLGPAFHYLRYQLPAGTEGLSINFLEDGLWRLLEGLGPLENRAEGPDPRGASPLQHPLLDAVLEQMRPLDMANRVVCLEDFLEAHLAPADPVADLLLRQPGLVRNPLLNPVKAASAQAELSQRTLQGRIRRFAGYSARELAAFLRFKKIITRLAADPQAEPDWMSWLHEAGYYDQSHLIREFRKYSGLSPKKFLEQLRSNQICLIKK